MGLYERGNPRVSPSISHHIELFSNEHSLYIMYTVLCNIYRCVASFIVPFHDSTRLTWAVVPDEVQNTLCKSFIGVF